MAPDYARKHVFIFDWDGTLFDSMALKTENFASTIAEYFPCSHSDAATQYRELGGHPRREIFAALAKRCGISANTPLLEQMSAALTERNIQTLKDAPLFPDVLPLLERLHAIKRSIFISSSVPQDELKLLVQEKLPKVLFEYIHDICGSSPGFSKGAQHIDHICATSKTNKEQCIVIGDDLADAQLAKTAGVDAVIIDREQRFADSGYCRIASLQEVSTCLR